MKRLLSTAVLLVLASCGSGGTSALLPPDVPEMVDLGVITSTGPTTFEFNVTNTTGQEASVSDVWSTGVVTVDTGTLPRTLAPGEVATFTVTLTPAGPGSIAELVMTKIFDAQGVVTDATTQVIAEAEAVQLSVGPAALDFGDVLPGGTADGTVTVTNDSAVSTSEVSAAALPTGAFALLDPLPVSVPPGQSADLTVRYTAAGPGTPSGDMTLTANSVAGTHTVALQATTGGEEIIDLGTQTFDANGDTDVLTFDVAADAIGFMIEATTNATTTLGLRLLTGPGGEEFENENLSGAYIWSPQSEIFTAQIPNNDDANLQPVQGGGTYSLRLLRWSGNASTCTVRIIVERRPATDTQERGTIDLNVFLANAIAPTAATAANDTTLQAVLTEVHTILSQREIRLGDIKYYDVTDPTYDDVTNAEFGPLLKLSSAASDVRLNLFFVRTAIGGGVLGVSPTLGGPPVNGTELSGVMSLYSTSYTPQFIGLVAAHEIGHFLGLPHTQESNGAHDNISDTDNCPSCTGAGGGYLMHWRALGGTTITYGQGLVIWPHPHVGPALAPGPQPKPTLPPQPIDVSPFDIKPNWCGTCGCAHK